MDFKDASTVPADPDGKQQHVVETFDIMDVGTTIALCVEPGEDYTAETVPERATAKRLGIHLAIVGDPKNQSTRAFLEQIRKGANG